VDLDPLAFAPQPDDAITRDRVAAYGELKGDAGREPLIEIAVCCGGGLPPFLVDPGSSASITATSSMRLVAIASISASSSGRCRRFKASAITSQPGGAGRRATISSKILRPSAIVSCRSFGLHPAADVGARLAGDHEGEPIGLRDAAPWRPDLDLVAIFERRAQRHHPAVDLGAHRLVAKVEWMA
jgi:hypothetical protein